MILNGVDTADCRVKMFSSHPFLHRVCRALDPADYRLKQDQFSNNSSLVVAVEETRKIGKQKKPSFLRTVLPDSDRRRSTKGTVKSSIHNSITKDQAMNKKERRIFTQNVFLRRSLRLVDHRPES